jgi:hypothetical protein
MFVRWLKRTRRNRAFGGGKGPDTHWAAVLVESERVAGKPVQHYLAYLGGITESAIELPAQRAGFWQGVVQQLDQLALPKHDRVRIEAAIEVKVPRLTRQQYDTWLARRARLGLGVGRPPSFRVCGKREE